MKSYVYLAANLDNNQVKIGWSFNPQNRITLIARESGNQIVLLKAIEGDVALERKLHADFSERRTIGEWFSDSDGFVRNNFLAKASAVCSEKKASRKALVATVVENFSEIIGELIERGWTQRELASEANTTQPVISELLHGTTEHPRYSTARMLIDLWKSRRKPKRVTA